MQVRKKHNFQFQTIRAQARVLFWQMQDLDQWVITDLLSKTLRGLNTI